MRIDRKYTLETLARLVQTNSINPTLAPGAPGEKEIATFIAESLRACGLTVETFEPAPGRTSVLGRLSGTGGGRSLMLNAHCDTVDVAGMAEPFSGAIRDGKLYGRGAYDMKGSLAACMAAAKAMKDSGTRLRGDLLVAAVADEEYGSLGTSDLITHIRVDGAIVTEPTALEVCLAHKGYLWIEVLVAGRAAHGSKFELGIDANMKMGHFLAKLSDLERDLRSRPGHPLVGPPSLHAAMLSGGTGLSTYAPSSTVQIERRTVPGETEAQATAEIQSIVDSLAAQDPDFHATVRPFFVREPFEVPAERTHCESRGPRRGQGARSPGSPHRRYSLDGRRPVTGRGSGNRGVRCRRRRRALGRGVGGCGIGDSTGGDSCRSGGRLLRVRG